MSSSDQELTEKENTKHYIKCFTEHHLKKNYCSLNQKKIDCGKKALKIPLLQMYLSVCVGQSL